MTILTSHPPESQLIDLASNLLSGEEAHEIMQHVGQCPECEGRLRALVADHESVRSGPTPVMIDGRITLSKGPRRRSLVVVRASVGAAVVAAVALGTFLVLNHHHAPAAYWIPVTNETNTLRGTGHGGLADALTAYQGHDAATAVEKLAKLEPLPDDTTSSTLRDLYLASALINTGRANDGLEILDRLEIQWMPTPWRYEAEWVKYVGLRQAGRDDEARSWLEKLASTPGENRARAQSEMERRKRD